MPPKAGARDGAGSASKDDLATQLAAKDGQVANLEWTQGQLRSNLQQMRQKLGREFMEKRRMHGDRSASVEKALRGGRDELEALKEAISRTKKAIEEVEHHSSQDLYARWRKATESRHRRGVPGVADDLDVAEFLRDEFGAVPTSEVTKALQEVEKYKKDYEDSQKQLAEANLKLRHAGRDSVDMDLKRKDRLQAVENQKSSNLAWWRCSLTDPVRMNAFREEGLRLEVANEQYSGEIADVRRQAASLELQIAASKSQAASLHRQHAEEVQKIHEQQKLLDHAQAQCLSLKKSLAAKEQELAQLVEVPIWRWEIVQITDRCDGLREVRERRMLRVDTERCRVEELDIRIGQLTRRLARELDRVEELEQAMGDNRRVAQEIDQDVAGLRKAYSHSRLERDRSAKLLRTVASIDFASPRLSGEMNGDRHDVGRSKSPSGSGRNRSSSRSPKTPDQRHTLAGTLEDIGRLEVPRPLPVAARRSSI
eukprot:gnl/MRDRNA2_/MRDRNA2_111184_c0_seq1.p1 gnl/MRDRNA2_/MRDRNA2_111184_c0~~gnl/MRDRNA2_/MRDRNA2_111184_c0_seq1.p1  ORF type:complete len:482 (+),score=109.52 gnl/MRDRNA2_/MRDRNA2_111184_c0_seq1:41-1486(+)